MFCKQCGAQLNDNAKFCTSCGAPTRLAQAETPAATTTSAMMISATGARFFFTLPP